MTERTKKILAALAIVVLIAFSALVGWFVGRPMIENVRDPEAFRLWVDAHGFLGKAAFVGMVVLQIIVALIPGEPLELGAGYAFGAWQGFLLCEIGILLGSALVFWFVRKFGVKLVEVFFPIEKIQNLKFLQNTERFHRVTFLVFFIPGTPKDLLCYVMGLTKIRFSTFLVITAVARVPSVITSTLAGGALGERNYLTAAIVFGVTLVLSLAGMKIYDLIVKKHQAKKEALADADAASPEASQSDR